MAVVAATGFFDGVHRGHREVLGKVCSIAALRGEESVAITFWPHPSSVLGSRGAVPLLTPSLDEKIRLIRECGISRVEVVPFTPSFAALSAADFVQQYLVERFGVSVLVLGYDHRFGHDRFDSVESLAALVRSFGVDTEIVPPYRLSDGTVLSSTYLRNCKNLF